MITLGWIYAVVGSMFATFAILGLGDRSHPNRFGTAAFSGLLAVSLLAGDRIGDFANGVLVLGLTILGGFNLLGRSNHATTSVVQREDMARRHGNRLFLPALIIPLTALLGTLATNYTPFGQAGWIEPKRETYVFLVVGVLLALAVILIWLRPPALAPLREGGRLFEAIGAAAVLPQMLAALGALFATAGIGKIIGHFSGLIIPDSPFLAVLVYGVGMVVFTMIMGNAFAAFPVMAAAIGVPVLIQHHHANPAVIGAVGMLAGFCGTLMTPMAANFNLVPAAVLQLRDQHGVIKAQFPTAIVLLMINILVMWWGAFL